MSKSIAAMMNQPAMAKLTSAKAEASPELILLAHVMATKPHTPLPRVSSVGTTAIFLRGGGPICRYESKTKAYTNPTRQRGMLGTALTRRVSVPKEHGFRIHGNKARFQCLQTPAVAEMTEVFS